MSTLRFHCASRSWGSSNAAAIACAVALSCAGCSPGSIDPSGSSGGVVAASLTSPTLVGVTVLPDRLTFSRSANAGQLDRIRAGAILVGPPDGSSNNPLGYLRRVRSLAVDGDTVVVATDPAALTDAILDARLHTSSMLADGASETIGGARLSEEVGGLAGGSFDFTGERILVDHTFLKDAGDAYFSVDVQPVISVKRGHASFRPEIDVALDIRDGRVHEFEYKASGDLTLDVALDVDVAVHGNLDASLTKTLAEHKFSQRVVLFRAPPVHLPPQLVGPIPVSESVVFDIAAECTLSVKGEVHGEVGFTADINAGFGGHYLDGRWTAIGGSPGIVFKPAAKLDDASAGFSLQCTAPRPELSLMFYDVAGPLLTVYPYLELDATVVSTAGPSWGLYPGVEADLEGHVQALGADVAVGTLNLWSWQADQPLVGASGGGGGGDTACNQAAVDAHIGELDACVQSGGGESCLTDGARYHDGQGNAVQLCGAGSGGGYSCSLDGVYDCVLNGGGAACFSTAKGYCTPKT